jgi:phage/plasmid-associated DNA primase
MYGRIIQRNTDKAISRRIRIIEFATVFGRKGEMSSSKDADKKPVPVSGGI